jgi:ABC-type polysaccharide/polyol phosphate transport system ATPase subunit
LPTSPDGAVAAEKVWKRFRADRPDPRLGTRLAGLGRQIRRQDRPRWRWALQDVSLHADPGDSIGLVGPNGSGKTTLLRLLTRVMYPYAGRVDVGGRVGALIEIRAGLHPELSGAQNVYFFGALLGLRRREVARRFDEIVSFAELEHALDRPVKYYSSGMQMRLGFAAASFLDPAVLLVDEVLAVGDASFQQRCLARMRELLGAGKTLIFVSHDLAAVETTCRRALWLEEGRVRADGDAREVLNAYRESIEQHSVARRSESADAVSLLSVSVLGDGAGPVATGAAAVLELVLASAEPHWCLVCVGVSEDPSSPIFVLRRDLHLQAGTTRMRCTVEDLPLPGGRYWLWVGVFDRTGSPLSAWHAVCAFDVAGPALDVPPPAVVLRAPVYVGSVWEIERG